MEMLRYLSDPDFPAPGTLCGIQARRQGELPELAEISSSDVVTSPTHQPQGFGGAEGSQPQPVIQPRI
jgi:hypothetical protein